MMHKAWCSIEEVPYYFSRSSIKFQGNTGWKIDDWNPIWVRLQGRSQLSNPSDLPCSWSVVSNAALRPSSSSAAIDIWRRHQMETFSALLGIGAGNSPVTGEFPAQRPVTRSFDVFFDLRQNKRLSKQSWGWWFETSSCPLWRHCNELEVYHFRSVVRVVSFSLWFSFNPSMDK